METRRWINQSQPQTLYIATILLYLNAVLGFLFGAFASPIGLVYVIGSAAGAYGIANERRWGYLVGVGVAGIQVALIAVSLALDPGLIFNLLFLANVIFPVALFLLLIHPMSRDYQRIWFK